MGPPCSIRYIGYFQSTFLLCRVRFRDLVRAIQCITYGFNCPSLTVGPTVLHTTVSLNGPSKRSVPSRGTWRDSHCFFSSTHCGGFGKSIVRPLPASARYFLASPSSRFLDGGSVMDSPTKARWLELCAEAAICENVTRLGQLATEIISILHEQERRLDEMPAYRLQR